MALPKDLEVRQVYQNPALSSPAVQVSKWTFRKKLLLHKMEPKLERKLQPNLEPKLVCLTLLPKLLALWFL
jgi:hypothetical protein